MVLIIILLFVVLVISLVVYDLRSNNPTSNVVESLDKEELPSTTVVEVD